MRQHREKLTIQTSMVAESIREKKGSKAVLSTAWPMRVELERRSGLVKNR